MKFLLVYFGIGIVVLIALWLLFRKTGVDQKGLRILWGLSLSPEGIILVPLLWPIIALLSLLWWIGDYWHLKWKQRDARVKAEAIKHATKYSHLTMDELLVAQKKMMDEQQSKK
jgi:hypothetical protein